MTNLFRHEIKYLISEKEYTLLTKRITSVLKHDHHYKVHQYHVRSLYFDDFMDRALLSKLDGLQKRKKYRIRLYNLDSSFIRLECKIKDNTLIRKEQVRISRKLCHEVIGGTSRKNLLDYQGETNIIGDLIDLFFIERFLYSPSILIDYVRETYTDPSQDVRISFDSNLSYHTHQYQLFDQELFMTPYFKEPMIILEVKYTKILPSYIKNLLQLDQFTQMALSKYAMCRLAKRTFTY